MTHNTFNTTQTELIAKVRNMKIMFSIDNCDTIPPEAKTLVQHMTKELIDTIHKTSLYYVKDRNIWRTTVAVEEGGEQKRRYISAKTKNDLYEKLYEFYIGPGTLADIHNKWVAERKTEKLAPKTVKRECQRWDKYIANSNLAQKRIDNITHLMIEDYFRILLAKNEITVKELKEILFLFKHTFEYAYRHDMIMVNPMDKVKVKTTSCAPTKPKKSHSRIYMPDEVLAMQHEIDVELNNIPHNTTALAIRLIFMTGIRIGEAVALRLSDVDFENQKIYIQRMEQEDNEGHREIVEHTKKKSTSGYRDIGIGEEGIALINQILAINEKYNLSDEDFLFLGEKGKRIHIRAIDNRIRKLCKRAGITPAKSAHDIRRTVATTLYRNTHDIELVRKKLGHSDVQTTWEYIVLVDKEEEDNQRVVDALKCLSDTPKVSDAKVIDFYRSKRRQA